LALSKKCNGPVEFARIENKNRQRKEMSLVLEILRKQRRNLVGLSRNFGSKQARRRLARLPRNHRMARQKNDLVKLLKEHS